MDVNQQRNRQLVLRHFNLDDVNWERLIENSQIKYKDSNENRKPVSDFGKSLLQICIENEDKNGWQLKDLMIRLLKDYNCDPNIMDFYEDKTLLTYC